MFNESFSLLYLAAAASALALICLAFFALYIQTLEKMRHITKANDHLRRELEKKPLKIVEKAHEQSLSIINEANRRAEEIIASTKSYEQESQTGLQDKLHKLEASEEESFQDATREVKRIYEEALTKIKEDNINVLTNITKEIEKNVLSEFQNFRGLLESETIGIQKTVQEKIEREFSSMQQELESYKQDKFSKIDSEIFKVLYKVSEVALGKGMTFEKHEQLVLDAIEQAKRESLFQ